MPLGAWSLEWLNHNENRSYPLAADGLHHDQSATFELPDDFIVDLTLAVAPAAVNYRPANFFISQIGVSPSGFSITIGYLTESGTRLRAATANIARSAFVEYGAHKLRGVDSFYDAEGTIVLGRLDSIDRQPAGVFDFDLEGARIEACVIRPQLRGVSSITVVNNGNKSAKLRGDLELIAGRNCRLTLDSSRGQTPSLRFDFIDGAGTVDDCDCNNAVDVALTSPIYRLGGVGPNSAGDLTLLGDECTEIETREHGLKLKDKCSQPCCGCPEYDAVKQALALFDGKIRTVENFAVRLDGSVTQFSVTALSTILKDRIPENCGAVP